MGTVIHSNLAEAVTPDQAPGFYTVAIFLVDRSYGGPEEGGWWYDHGVLMDYAVAEAGEYGIPAIFRDKPEAYAHAAQVQQRLDDTINKGLRPISSVLSEGRYQTMVFPGFPPDHWPESRPHYE